MSAASPSVRAFSTPALYAIADADTVGVEGVPSVVATAAAAGVEWIQVRAKSIDDRTLFSLVGEAVERSRPWKTRIWVDDRADVAALLPVAGVHVGQSDLPPSAVRRVIGPEKWIGLSTHTREQFEEAAGDSEVDVIAVGPIFATRSKRNAEPSVGLDLLRWARSRTRKPIVAIGGVDAGSLAAVLEAGADSAVALGAVCRGDVARNCRELLEVSRACAAAEPEVR